LSPDALHAAIVLAPFLALPFAAWLGGRGRRGAALLACVPAALTAYFVYLFSAVDRTAPFTATVRWAPGLGLALSFQFDGLGILFATLVVAIGTLIVLYAATYMDGNPRAGRFHVSLFAFMGSMLGLVLSDNVVALFVFWELTGFTSYLLIGFESERREARRAAMQALLVTGAGGLAWLAAGLLLSQIAGTGSLSEMLNGGVRPIDDPRYLGVASLVLLAAFTKSAQFPFHFWLPNAMQAPTPVSAYLHSATMVKAGVYLIARMTPLLGGSLFWTGVLMLAGGLTMIGGSYRAMLETDLKRVLAYSTIGALGVLTLLLGIGTPAAVTASLLYLLAHACYKGGLFLVAGAIEHETGTREVSQLHGLRDRMRWTAAAAALAAASMAGVPLFFGFIAKEQFYAAAAQFAPSFPWVWIVVAGAVLASAFLGAAGFIAGVGPFIGRTSAAAEHSHEAPRAMWLPPLTLGAVGLAVGLFPAFIDAPVGLAVASVVRAPAAVHLAVWHGLTPILGLSLLTLAAAAMLFASRETIRRVAWPRALRTERLYSGTLALLDSMSRRVAPWLQSASLRSYLLVVVVTAVALVGTALATRRILPAPSRWTPFRLYEGLIAVLIIAAAVSAARARSTIGAVLSLGIVGYGVALTFALFGAPDLAMTQFAVETLTVVIFVLVFRHLRGFGDLSTKAVKVRDAAVAIAAGTLITTLVLFISASGTTSRLSAFFTGTAPALAHGRNVVNVILVDFRGFDTMGEITVLVTVAVGVRALLRIASERRG
jgi:multicomponent Na+:H+ antiporter subunit A